MSAYGKEIINFNVFSEHHFKTSPSDWIKYEDTAYSVSYATSVKLKILMFCNHV